MGLYEAVNEEEREMLETTDLGEFAMFEGEMVPLDFPMHEESLEEAEYKGKKVELGKPTTGDAKKYKVYVRDPKTGNVKKVSYGDKKGGLKGNWNDPEARASFAKRHKCAQKKDKTSPGYWACRAHKHFGKNVPSFLVMDFPFEEKLIREQPFCESSKRALIPLSLSVP